MDEHSLQSPFVYQLYTEALKLPAQKYRDEAIESIRKQLQSNKRTIAASGFGAGSNLSTDQSNDVRQIARLGISNRRGSEVLCRLIDWFRYQSVLELGTSLGINTAYISKCNSVKRAVTIEGNEELATEAQTIFSKLGLNNIELVNKDIDLYFDNNQDRFDLIYIDANHTYEATIRYFERSLDRISDDGVIILDDINWSMEMHQAWSEIKKSRDSEITVENDQFGMVFMSKYSTDRHYVLRF